MRSVNHLKLSAFILAGGGSSRFGKNKALASGKGKPLIVHVIDNLTRCFETVAIVAKQDTPYLSLGYPVVQDELSGQSPLVGIYSGLLHSKTDWNFFTACDMPFLSCDIIRQISGSLKDEGGSVEIMIPITSVGMEPLAGFYNRSLVPVLKQNINLNMALRTFVRSRNYKTVEFESTKPFTNVNTQDEFARIDR